MKTQVMTTTNIIGLETEKTEQLAYKLDKLLADYQMFYMNLRGFHWNIKGDKFFELHNKFEELYNETKVRIDEIAERIVTLGHTPWHSFQDYIENSSIESKTDVSTAKETVCFTLDGFKSILVKQREILNLSDEMNDEGTNSLMSDYITEQEKHVWMLSAYLS
jgi:starvation-inducible DNA-binding protein